MTKLAFKRNIRILYKIYIETVISFKSLKNKY